jgi:flagellar protein FliS
MSLHALHISEYNRNAILSATPAQLLTMLYDRLLLDLERAQLAQTTERWLDARENLLHAQDIVTELQGTLDVAAWDGGPGLFALYNYVSVALVNANINRNVALTAECIALLEPLRQTWHEAAAGITIAPKGAWSVA